MHPNMSSNGYPRSGATMTLSDLYDADRRARDVETARIAGRYRIPHPLGGVTYADGTAPRSAGREVRSPWIGGPDA